MFGAPVQAASDGYADAPGRPTVGDTVRLHLDMNDLTAGTLCTVTYDFNQQVPWDGTEVYKRDLPYKLTALGSSRQTGRQFNETFIQKVVRMGSVVRLCCARHPGNAPG